MALVRHEPFGGLATLRREMDRLFEDFFDGAPLGLWERTTGPAVEVSDTRDAVLVKAQVPGVSKDNLQISVSNDALTLKGELNQEEKKEDAHYYQREFRYGAFERIIPLPVAVQADKVSAQLKDGLLEITLPKSEQAKVKQISIATS